MALERPTLKELKDKLFSNLSTSLFGFQAPDENSIVGIISKVFSSVAHSIYVYIDRNGRTPWDATGSLLLGFAKTCGIEPFIASRSYGTVTVNGSGFIPKGTLLRRCDSEVFSVLNDVNWPNDPIVVKSLNLGLNTNTSSGTELIFSTPIAGISTNAVVDDPGLTGGQDNETEIQLRKRVISCYRSRCQNGKSQDYIDWGFQYPGVTRVYPIAKANGPGTVKVFFMMDETYPNGIPSQGDVDALQAIIDDNIPLGVCATVCAPNPIPIDLTIHTQNTTNIVRDNITESIREIIKGFGPGIICRADLTVAIRSVYDGCFEIITPNNDIIVNVGNIAVLGTVSYGILNV